MVAQPNPYTMKRCRACMKWAPMAASKCGHCGSDLKSVGAVAPPQTDWTAWVLWSIGGVTALLFLSLIAG